MDLTDLIGAAVIALGSAAIVMITVRSYTLLSRVMDSTPFADSMMYEAAEQFRNDLKRLSEDQALYLGAILGFIVVFSIYSLLPAVGLFEELRPWQLAVAVVLLAGAAALVSYRLWGLAIMRRKLRLLRDANIAIGHALQKLSGNRVRVFHDVACGNTRIDHVVAGLHGIYAVSVVARKPPRDNAVSINGGELSFAADDTVSLDACAQAAAWLATEIKKQLCHPVRVRTVVACPGWDIDVQSGEHFLVVNERNVAMLTGWKDQGDLLLNEDVEAVHRMLTDRCSRRQGS